MVTTLWSLLFICLVLKICVYFVIVLIILIHIRNYNKDYICILLSHRCFLFLGSLLFVVPDVCFSIKAVISGFNICCKPLAIVSFRVLKLGFVEERHCKLPLYSFITSKLDVFIIRFYVYWWFFRLWAIFFAKSNAIDMLISPKVGV